MDQAPSSESEINILSSFKKPTPPQRSRWRNELMVQGSLLGSRGNQHCAQTQLTFVTMSVSAFHPSLQHLQPTRLNPSEAY